MEGLEQSNAGLTSSNSAVMAQLVQMNATMNAMKAQSKTSTNPTRTRRKITVGAAEEISLMEVKYAPKNQATTKRHTSRKDLGAVKMCENDG